MARVTSQVQDDVLVHDGTERVAVGSPAWFAWLEQASTFAFVSSQGRFTARKEQGARGSRYWKAYRTQAGKLRRVYLGNLTDFSAGFRLIQHREPLSAAPYRPA